MEMADHQLLDTLKKVQNEIQVALGELNSIKAEMKQREADEQQCRVFKFIDGVRISGLLDLTKINEYIEKRFDITNEKAEKYLFDYIENMGASVLTPSVPEPVKPLAPLVLVSEQAEVTKEPIRKGPKPYSMMTPEELVIAKAARAARAPNVEADKKIPEISGATGEVNLVQPVKRVISSKKSTIALAIWNSFVKVVQAEMEATGIKPAYDEVVKKAREMKESDQDAYNLFSSTWSQDEKPSSSNSS